MGKKNKSSNKYRVTQINNTKEKNSFFGQYKGILGLSLALLLIIGGTSYALFSTVLESKKTLEVEAGTFNIRFLESNYINLQKAYPMTDEEGLNTNSYEFSITNTGTLDGRYNINLEDKEDNTLDKRYVKYSIKENDGQWSRPALLSNGITLASNKLLKSGAKVDYQLKLWLDQNAPNETQGKVYAAKIVVSAAQTQGNIIDVEQPIINLNGADTMSLVQNDTFIDPGVSKVTDSEEISVSNITTRYEYYDGTTTTAVANIDTSKIGTYYIYYEVLDSESNKGISVRVVNVYREGTIPPIISLIGDSQKVIDYNGEYLELGATAQDNTDGDLTSGIITEGAINTSSRGIQIIKYLIKDSEGNTSSVVRRIYVK